MLGRLCEAPAEFAAAGESFCVIDTGYVSHIFRERYRL